MPTLCLKIEIKKNKSINQLIFTFAENNYIYDDMFLINSNLNMQKIAAYIKM